MKLIKKARKTLVIAVAVSAVTTSVYAAEADLPAAVRAQSMNAEAPIIKGLSDIIITTKIGFSPTKGVTAFDKNGNDLTMQVRYSGNFDTRVPGLYTLTYKVTDISGATTSTERYLYVLDKAKQEPTIFGLEDISITSNELFEPLKNVKAFDKNGKDITNHIRFYSNDANDTDDKLPGTYTLGYEVTDERGVTTTLVRNIIVVAN